jgi:hypothetical protein
MTHNDGIEALAPCPFCPDGGDPTVIGPDANFTVYVLCDKCGSRGTMMFCGHGGTTEEAISAWNRRSAFPIQAAEPVVKVLGVSGPDIASATALLADLHTALRMLRPNALGININVYPSRTRRDELLARIELALYGVERPEIRSNNE